MLLKKQTIAILDKHIVLEPDNANLYCDRAELKYELGRYTEAIADYDKAIALNPDLRDDSLLKKIVEKL